MPHFIPDIIILFGAGLSLLTSLGQLTLRERRTENYNLVFLFLVLGLCLLQIYFVTSGLYLERPGSVFLFLTYAYLLGPILFIAYYYVIFPVRGFPVRKTLLFIPSMAAFIVDLYYFFQPKNVQIQILNGIFPGREGLLTPFVKSVIAGSSVQAIAYLTFLLILLFREKSRHDHGTIMNVDICYSVFSMAAHAVLVSGAVFSSLTLITLGGVMSSLLLICAYVVGFRFPEFLHLFFIRAVRKGGKSPISGIETDEVMERLMKLINDEKIYSEEDITLQDLADELSLTIHQTSRLINEQFNMNFNNFINKFRVDEAGRILVDDSSRSIISIAHEVGFSSKSAFYSAFSRFTGVTPTVFRKEKTAKARV
ncbi:MAG TPA: helix-turn-helix domain-containing protein [Spirochaetota bacterium]|nr:helix-turn-helix domain-containing protein [Spirochaetota bacterium]HSA14397.1 helix-turn-helix domain-containing protein [Spirochaetota bacterium]